ncbi:type II toxin-antitoxin system RelE/ParE family toxin [Atlantibacter subterranea]|uniref:Type II toxin-antitoxin system RelE/ParE family toxin n=1 Tax=Atlantibacter subterraneus TaxID=255519 RepID=A0A427UYN7_9ENTR|nr:type II toxin-antitoxin system RelE/ParE family toxin [Atlantibacter subterranea]MDA3134244.1 type II toxin-antitoxin system RelE/ParE family toxin [Atlantibacter subterranea]RSB61821.1 type II toxin-antitoxin system RelE/ParE family toxin [Atlantibacter subterranea]RSE04386.1 type II toxin-antitoxin system RelE/ParE family toxin [Atlantibacter subterranea]RSE25619.1 type II toxin-antitoxin system RelE/ParE family toxin [Atlantibacter subterranea]
MWEVITTDVFDEWLFAQHESLREDVLAAMHILEEFGPHLGRPYADTLHGSIFPNLKELRIQHDGNPIRAFFAFDPRRRAVVLCAGDKTGVNEKRFYKEMIRLAESEYRRYLVQEEKNDVHT